MRLAPAPMIELAVDATAASAPTFATIYEQYAAFVWRALRRFGIPERDVEDVCQEVFLVVHTKFAQFERRSSIKTWLYGIAFRRASEFRRRAYVSRETLVDIPIEEPVDPAQSVVLGRALLDRILDELDDDKRAVFVLYELEALTMAEVAEALECPLQTAYSRLYSARATVEAAVTRLRAREVRS